MLPNLLCDATPSDKHGLEAAHSLTERWAIVVGIVVVVMRSCLVADGKRPHRAHRQEHDNAFCRLLAAALLTQVRLYKFAWRESSGHTGRWGRGGNEIQEKCKISGHT